MDHSIVRLTWQPDLCKDQSGRYRLPADPTLTIMGPGKIFGLGLELRAAEHTSTGVMYRGRHP